MHPFHGLSQEHPMDHIERFEDLISSNKAEGVSYDYLPCKLFPYSLVGKASSWLKQLKPGSLTTWKEIKVAFLNNFYNDARSEELRMKISTFSQEATEAFKAVWIRFRGYQRDCPHHGFSEVQLLGIFFRGVDWHYQMALDAASNGNFMSRYPEDATMLIDSLASSISTKSVDIARKTQVQYVAQVESLATSEKMDQQRYMSFNQQSIHQKPVQQTKSFIQNHASSTQIHPPPETTRKIESLLEQILKGQEKQTTDFDHKLVALSDDMNRKIQILNNRIKQLTTNKEDVRAIELRSGKQLNPVLQRELPAAKIVNLEENDVAVFADQTPVSTDTASCRSTPAMTDTTERDSVDRHQQGVDRHQPCPNLGIRQNPISAAAKVTKPKVPFPKSPRKSKHELEDARCKDMMDKLIVEMPLIDVVKSSPMIRQFVKRMVTKDMLTEKAVMTMSTQVNDIIQNKIPQKLPDPGSFVLNCGIFTRVLINACAILVLVST